MPTTKPILPAESFEDAIFPVHGLNLSCEWETPPPGTTPIGLNVRTFEPSTMRGRGGARPGLAMYLPQVPSGAHAIQHLNYIVDPQEEAVLGNQDASFLWPYSQLEPDLSDPGSFVRKGGGGSSRTKSKGKKTLTIRANNIDVPIGTPLDATLYTVTGLLVGDSVTSVTLTADAGAEDGTASRSDAPFTITPSAALGVGLSKYKITYTPGTWTVPDIAFVQTNFGQFAGDSTPHASNGSVGYLNPVDKGNLLLVAVANSASVLSLTVTDTIGNIYTRVFTDTAGGNRMSFYTAISTAVGVNTVNVAWGVDNGPTSFCILEYSGVNRVFPFDSPVTGGTTGGTENTSPATLATGVIPVSDTGELLVCIFMEDACDTVITAPVGMTQRCSGSLQYGIEDFYGIFVADKLGIDSSASSLIRTFTVSETFDDLNFNSHWTAIGGSFQ